MCVLPQGVFSSSDLFNILMDSDTRLNSDALKSMDDLLFSSETLDEIKNKIERFLGFCRKKELKC